MTTISHIPFPLPDKTIVTGYFRLVAEVDDAVRRLTSIRFSGTLRCRPGCSSCCTAFSILPLEAALLVRQPELAGVEQATTDNQCRLLVNDRCMAYQRRPIICRTQGVPIAYIEAETIEVSACPLNFNDDYNFVHEELLFLDHFNQRLAELNLRYCRTMGFDPQTRIPIAAIGHLRQS